MGLMIWRLWVQTPLEALFDEIYFVLRNLKLSDNRTEMRHIGLSWKTQITDWGFEADVLPFTLDILKDDCHVSCSLFTQIVAQCNNWELPWTTAVHPKNCLLLQPSSDIRIPVIKRHEQKYFFGKLFGRTVKKCLSFRAHDATVNQ